MKKSLLALSAMALLFTACKKDKDEQKADVTPTVQNLTGSYKIVKIAVKVASSPEQDMTDDYLEPCEKDDIHKLNANLTFEYLDAGTQCDPVGGYEGDWKLNSSTSIEVDGETFTIRKFDGKNLELTDDYGTGSVISYLIKQ